MKLLYVCNDFGIPLDGTKGPSIHVRAITRALAEAGCDVRICSPRRGPGAGHPARRLLPAGCEPAEKAARPLKHWLADHGLDAALGQELRPLLYNAWAGPRASEALRSEPADVILERLALHSGLGLDLAREHDTPLVLEVNALLTEEFSRFRSLALAPLAREIEDRMLHNANAIVTVSAALAERIRARGVPGDRVHVVPNGADLSLFENLPPRDATRRALGIPDGAYTVGFVGSLKVWHGADVLLDAFGRLLRDVPAARLLIVGTGPTHSDLRQQAAALGVADRVIFTGAVPHEQIPALIAAMDVACAPYRPLDDFYFSPIKLFEYMAAGTCAVASKLGQIEEVITDGVHGRLFDAGDAAALARILRELHADPQQRRALAASGRQRVRERFTWNHAARATLAVLEQVVATHRRTRPAATAEVRR